MARKKEEGYPSINVIEKLVDIMLGNVIIRKYLYIGSPLIDVPINNIVVPNTLIYLGVSINVMTR